MDAGEIDRRLADVKARLQRLPPEDQERAIEGFAQVLTVLALPRGKDEPVSLSISLDRGDNIEYPSG